MNCVRSNNLSLKYQRFIPSGCKGIGSRKLEFMAKTQFLFMFFLTGFLLVVFDDYWSLIGPIYQIGPMRDKIKAWFELGAALLFKKLKYYLLLATCYLTYRE